MRSVSLGLDGGAASELDTSHMHMHMTKWHSVMHVKRRHAPEAVLRVRAGAVLGANGLPSRCVMVCC
jgi:hypothetical protein